MPSDPPITTTGIVVAQRNAKTCLATLPNGKEIVAFLNRTLLEKNTSLVAGDKISLELTPYDFSQARIVAHLPQKIDDLGAS